MFFFSRAIGHKSIEIWPNLIRYTVCIVWPAVQRVCVCVRVYGFCLARPLLFSLVCSGLVCYCCISCLLVSFLQFSRSLSVSHRVCVWPVCAISKCVSKPVCLTQRKYTHTQYTHIHSTKAIRFDHIKQPTTNRIFGRARFYQFRPIASDMCRRRFTDAKWPTLIAENIQYVFRVVLSSGLANRIGFVSVGRLLRTTSCWHTHSDTHSGRIITLIALFPFTFIGSVTIFIFPLDPYKRFVYLCQRDWLLFKVNVCCSSNEMVTTQFNN